MTREEWLIKAIDTLRPLFVEAEQPVPEKVYVSVGWPGGRGKKSGVVGQCWAASHVADGSPAVFISPVLDKPVEVLETLVHELVHAVGHNGHRGGFVKLAKRVGLKAPWKSSGAGDELLPELERLAGDLGPYPHARITTDTAIKRQGTRMLKIQCPSCGYAARTTQMWLDVGLPSCPEGETMERV